MADATSKAAGKVPATESAPTTARDGATATAVAITPAAALARHVEWLEFALAAARSEEAWRTGRLDKATKKSRDKRTARLADVRDEIAELAALIAGIRGLQAPTGPRATARSTRSGKTRAGTKPRTSASTSRSAA